MCEAWLGKITWFEELDSGTDRNGIILARQELDSGTDRNGITLARLD